MSSQERGEGKAALIVSALTAASRVFGFVRTLVMAGVLGLTFLGNTYATANAIPNVVFEIIAGGAVAAFLLPVIGPLLARGDKAAAHRTAAGILNAALLIVTPFVVLGIALREPLMQLLTSAVEDPALRAAEIKAGSFLLLMFLPQIWFYVVGIVLTAVLHGHRRFAAPALAPLVSSITVTAAYLIFASVEAGRSVEGTSTTGLLILGLGTSAGVAMLGISLLPAVRNTGFRWTATVAISFEARSKLRTVALPAAVSVGAQQVLLAVVVVIANKVSGGVVAYQLAFTVLLVFWAVLAVPVATTAFPGLVSAEATGDRTEFARRCSKGARSVVLIVLGGAALLAAISRPAAGAMLSLGISGEDASIDMVASTMAAFAPGLIGYGLYAFFSRASFALNDGNSPALAAVAGFGLAIAANIAAAFTLGTSLLVPALAAGFSAGMLAGIVVLVARLRQLAGPEALKGFNAAAVRGALAAVVAAGAGIAVVQVMALREGFLGQAATTASAAAAAVAVYVAALWLAGQPEVRSLIISRRATA